MSSGTAAQAARIRSGFRFSIGLTGMNGARIEPAATTAATMDIRNVLLETVWDDIIAALTVSCPQVTHSGHSKKEAPKQTPGPKRGLAMRGWLIGCGPLTTPEEET